MIRSILHKTAPLKYSLSAKNFSTLQLTSVVQAQISNALHVPRLYADVNDKMPSTYWDYESYEYKVGNSDDYEVTDKIGRGKYSEVFEGFNVVTNQKVIIKILKPIKSRKIKREIRILEILKGNPNIVTLLDVIKPTGPKMYPSYVFECLDDSDFKSLIPQLNDFEVRYYMYEILKALDYAHSKGIMHRDVKPQNIIVNHKTKMLKLIDWGLGEFYHPGHEYHVRVASRYYKGPELLVDDQYYDYSLDIWSAGVMFAGMILKKEPFFKGKDNEDQLVKITNVLGTDKLYAYLEKYGLKLGPKYAGLIYKMSETPWSAFVNAANDDLATPEAIDLISKMLVYDKSERILAKEALEHPYFDPVRK